MAGTYVLAKTTPNADATIGNRRRRVRDATVTGTYTTGGDAILPAAFGLRRIDEFLIHGTPSDGTVAYDWTYVYSSNKLKLWETGSAGAGSDEKGSGEALTNITFRVTAIGV